MPGKRISELTALSGAGSANNDDVLIFDTTANETKRISRSQLAEGMQADVQVLTNKTIALGSNTVTGTTAQFNTALTDNNFATQAGAEALTNKTIVLASNTVNYTQGATGAVTRTAQSRLQDFVSIKDFGAVGNGVADDTAAIQAAADYCETSGAFLYGAPGTYLITSTIVLKCDCDLSLMTVRANGAVFSPAIRVGPAAAAQYLFDADLKLPFVINTAKTVAGWTGFDTSIGVLCANVYQSRITVPSVYNFGVGLKVGGYSVGNVYNTYTIGVLFNNKINLQCKPSDSGGWSNQNTFIGGRYGYSSAEGVAVAGIIQIQLRDFADGGVMAPNNNTWLNPSVEGDEPQFHMDIQGAVNTFISPRMELGTGIPARVNFHAATAGETTTNNIIGGYDFSSTTYTFSGAGTSVRNKKIGGGSADAFEYSGCGINIVNRSGSSRTAPHIQGFLSSVSAIAKDNTSTDWIYRLHGDGLSVKSSADAQDRIQLNSSGYLYFGRGGSAPTAGFRASPFGDVNAQSNVQPEADNTRLLGAASNRWSQVYGTQLRPGDGTVIWTSGAGTPEAAVTAPVGSLYTRTDGGAVTTLYVKETGTGNTGWVAK